MSQLLVVLTYVSIVVWLAARFARVRVRELARSIDALAKEVARVHGALSMPPGGPVTPDEPRRITPPIEAAHPTEEGEARFSTASASYASGSEFTPQSAGAGAETLFASEPAVAVATPRLDGRTVREVYAAWLAEDESYTPEGMEVHSLRLVNKLKPGPFSDPVLQFEDVEGLGELVRVSPAGGSIALVLPHPRIRERSDIWRRLFPDWNDEYIGNRSRVAELRPIQMRKKNDLWTRVTE